MKYFDTHAHLGDSAFDIDRDELIPALNRGGLSLCVDVACEMGDFSKTLALSSKYTFIYGAYGIHPHYASNPGDGWEMALRSALSDKKAVALGEIGLDYHYDLSAKDDQKRLFEYQLDMAYELDMPVILHIREAFGDCMEILRAHKGRFRGVMHCFSGSAETARECVDLGLYIAFGGAVTFANARKLIDAASAVPDARLLVETDCPYLSPVPVRGRRNDPSNIPYVVNKLAEIRETDAEHIARVTLENGKRLFGIIDG